MTVEADKKAARIAICRGAKPGAAIPKCRCFQDGTAAILSRPDCKGACEDAVDFVAKAIAAEREACAQVADNYARDGRIYKEYACETADEIAARIRSRLQPAAAAESPSRLEGVTSPDCVMVPKKDIAAVIDDLAVGCPKTAVKHLVAMLSAAPPSPRSDEIKKRPSAFRVWINEHWAYFDDEDVARAVAGKGDYQGLYVRDGGQP